MLAFAVIEFTKSYAATQMDFFVGIASRTTQRAFACDLDGEGRLLSLEDLLPRAQYFCSLHNFSFSRGPRPAQSSNDEVGITRL
jgi:hypothetical protein